VIASVFSIISWSEAVAHISRKELKKNEFRETFEHGAEAVLSHQRLTIYLLSAAIVIALGVFGWRTYTQRQTMKASAAFNSAMEVYGAPILPAGQPPVPGAPTYTDEKIKFTDAAKRMADVAKLYPGTHPGQLAGYFEALSLEKIDKNDDAKKLLRSLADNKDEDFTATAQYELAQLDDRTGQADEALQLYQGLMAKPTVLVPKPMVMLSLAEHYGSKNVSEAAKIYAQIKSDYPNTPIAEQADQELTLLPGKS
jgi:predicted negative regulator of RcsB-dependent stress response